MNLHSLRSIFQPTGVQGELTRAGLTLKGRRARGVVRLMLARSVVRLRHISLPAELSVTDRWGALRAEALSWQPFERSQCRFGLHGDRGLVMAWDSDRVTRELTAQELAMERVVLWPDTVLCKPPAEDGLRLLQASEGYEGQCWRSNMLMASRWWPALPTEAEWLDFARGSPADAAWAAWSKLPEAEALDLLPEPWLPTRSPEQMTGQIRRAEQWLVRGVGLLLIGATVPVLRDAYGIHQQKAALEAEVAALREATAPTLKFKSEALAALRRAQVASDELLAVQPMDVLQYLADYLPKQGVTLREFDLEGLKLKLNFELGPGVSRTALVERMQASGWFSSVTEQQAAPQPNLVSYVVTLDGSRPPAPAKAASSSDTPKPPGAASSGGK